MVSGAPKLFAQPEALAINSSFGGGWIIPLTPRASEVLATFFNEEPAELAPLGGRVGHIVEPYLVEGLAEYLNECGIAWGVE